MMQSTVSPNKLLVVSDVRSNENVGSLFRTADAVGIQKLYLTGITPLPIDRFGRVVRAISKTALGAECTVLWEYAKYISDLLQQLKAQGYQTIAIEQCSTSVDYKTVIPAERVVFVVGNEVTGIEEHILKLADIVVEIPMKGTKESLNVSVATGVALFRMLDR